MTQPTFSSSAMVSGTTTAAGARRRVHLRGATILASLFAASAAIAPAVAAPASQAEADRLTALFERYIGHPAEGQPAGVAVVPDGDSYKLSVDIAREMKPLEAFHITLEPATAVLRLTPKDDGTWGVTSDGLPPLTVHTTVQTIKLTQDYKLSGTFDPKLGAFSDFTTTSEHVVTEGLAPRVTQRQTVEKSTTVQTAKAAGNTGSGAVAADIDLQSALTGMANKMLVSQAPAPGEAPAAPGGEGSDMAPAGPPVAVDYTIPSAGATVKIAKLHMKDLLELWAFLMAHPGRDAKAAAQEEFRGLLRNALPVFDALAETVSLDQFSMTTPLGAFAMKRFGFDFQVADLPATGTAGLGLNFDGLTVPTGQLPPWTVDLVPTSVDMKASVTGFRLADAAKQAVDAFDYKADKALSREQEDAIAKTAWPSEGGKFVLAPSKLTGPMLSLRLDGEATVGPQGPNGRLSIVGTGLDAVIATLQTAAADPTAAQVLTQVVAAKNLAKPNSDGSLSWEVLANPEGAVTVNGVPLK